MKSLYFLVVKAWLNGLVNRRKDLRAVALPLAFALPFFDSLCVIVSKVASPFGHPAKVCTQLQRATMAGQAFRLHR